MDQLEERIYLEMEQSVLYFVKQVWGLVPQRVKPEYQARFTLGLYLKGKAWDDFCVSVRPYWFMDYREGLDLTWQQALILHGIDKAIKGDIPMRISIVSGHGIGKSMLLSVLILWFLFVHPDSQVACTSPGKEQMYDVLWKELKKWIDKMEPMMASMYEWEASHIRMKESPQTWFARAKTASKENTEALAGVHADWVLMAVDEACHDNKTEILTDKGWKLFKDLIPTDLVMTLINNQKGEWQKPTRYHEYEHNGDMISSNLRATDFMVTPNHDLYVKTRDKGYRKVKAESINGTDLFIPRTITWNGIETYSEDEMRLAGWFVSEGSFKKYKNGKVNAVVISHSKEKNNDNYVEIAELLERMGYVPKFSKGDIVVHNVVLARKMLAFGDGFKNKNIPSSYKEQSPRLLSIMLDAFTKGDGYSRSNRDILYTSSPRLADDLQEVILKTGFNSTITKRKLKGKKSWIKDHWATSSCDGLVISRSHKESHSKINYNKIKKVHYEGKVYCVTVPNGIVMTRRNGCVMWSGNSGVEETIFETMEGALTSGNVLVFLISNGTRSIGYFYDTHHKDRIRWQNYAFSSLESPRVDEKYVQGIVDKYGDDSVQYAIRVKGEFPDEGVMDASGYVQLFNESDLHFVPFDSEWKPVGRPIGALDPSGEGQDKSEWAIRDRAIGAIVAEEDTSNSGGMATKSVTLCDKYQVDPSDFVIDAFGKGHDVSMEIALVTSQQKRPWRVYPVNTGEPCEDEVDRLTYINKRAEGYHKMMKWCRAGGELMESHRLKEQLMSIRFKRTSNGRVQIMDKPTMKKLGFDSPDKADALSMTFLRKDGAPRSILGDMLEKKRRGEFDEHSPVGD